MNPARSPYFALSVGVLSVSCGAIFTRYAQVEAASLSIAAYRMGFAFVIVLIPTWMRHRRELLSVDTRDLKLAALAGFFLAFHFATWIYSLEMTSVAVSVVLVNTAPLWVGLLTVLLTSEQLTKLKILSMFIAVIGAGIIGWDFANIQESSSDFIGALLAIAGAIGLAAYLILGRSLLQQHSLGVYITCCYASAACYLWLAAMLTQQPLVGYSVQTWLCMLSLAVISQCIGHSANNWALRFFSAAMVSVALLCEPILSTFYAFLLFHETPTLPQCLGAAIVLIGVCLAIHAE